MKGKVAVKTRNPPCRECGGMAKYHSPKCSQHRCKHCGIEGHNASNCELKKEGERELAREAERRRKDSKPMEDVPHHPNIRCRDAPLVLRQPNKLF